MRESTMIRAALVLAIVSLVLNVVMIGALYSVKSKIKNSGIVEQLENLKNENITLTIPVHTTVKVPLVFNYNLSFNRKLSFPVHVNQTIKVPIKISKIIHVAQNVTTTVNINGREQEVTIPIDTYVPVNFSYIAQVPLNLTIDARVPVNLTVPIRISKTISVPINTTVNVTVSLKQLGLEGLINNIISAIRGL